MMLQGSGLDNCSPLIWKTPAPAVHVAPDQVFDLSPFRMAHTSSAARLGNAWPPIGNWADGIRPCGPWPGVQGHRPESANTGAWLRGHAMGRGRRIPAVPALTLLWTQTRALPLRRRFHRRVWGGGFNHRDRAV